jgi:hypothetical protein
MDTGLDWSRLVELQPFLDLRRDERVNAAVDIVPGYLSVEALRILATFAGLHWP